MPQTYLTSNIYIYILLNIDFSSTNTFLLYVTMSTELSTSLSVFSFSLSAAILSSCRVMLRGLAMILSSFRSKLHGSRHVANERIAQHTTMVRQWTVNENGLRVLQYVRTPNKPDLIYRNMNCVLINQCEHQIHMSLLSYSDASDLNCCQCFTSVSLYVFKLKLYELPVIYYASRVRRVWRRSFRTCFLSSDQFTFMHSSTRSSAR